MQMRGCLARIEPDGTEKTFAFASRTQICCCRDGSSCLPLGYGAVAHLPVGTPLYPVNRSSSTFDTADYKGCSSFLRFARWSARPTPTTAQGRKMQLPITCLAYFCLLSPQLTIFLLLQLTMLRSVLHLLTTAHETVLNSACASSLELTKLWLHLSQGLASVSKGPRP